MPNSSTGFNMPRNSLPFFFSLVLARCLFLYSISLFFFALVLGRCLLFSIFKKLGFLTTFCGMDWMDIVETHLHVDEYPFVHVLSGHGWVALGSFSG